MSDDDTKTAVTAERINAAISIACTPSFGVLDSSFLSQSLSLLLRAEPWCVTAEVLTGKVVQLLREHSRMQVNTNSS